eukprot:scaffold37123_cov128-Skeletonema_dohrnii-CCMP3373.AAC.3
MDRQSVILLVLERLLLECGLAVGKDGRPLVSFGWLGLPRLGSIMNCVPPHQFRAERRRAKHSGALRTRFVSSSSA